MPTFFRRRYFRGKPKRTERIVGGCVIVLTALIVGTFLLTGGLLADTVNAAPGLRTVKNWIGISGQPLFVGTIGEGASDQARFVDVEGLTTPAKIERYTDNLYEKINGKESMYRGFLFEELRFGQYIDAQGSDLYDVYVFDQGTTANAFGIYMAERSRKADVLDIGRDGYASGTSVYFVKGKYYVYILGPPEGGDPAIDKSKRIAAAIADTITDAGEPFWAETYLPTEDRVLHSFSYQATNALGYDFLSQLFLAEYETNGIPYGMYLLDAGNPGAAADLFDKFAEATAQYDKIVAREPVDGGRLFVSDSLGIYGVTFHAGRFFGGVKECDDRELAEKKAAVLRAKLEANRAS